MKVGILTGGGDVPGLNACIRSVVLSADDLGWEVLGFRRGWDGVTGIDPDDPGAGRAKLRRDSEQGEQRLGETAEDDHHRHAEQQPEHQSGAENVAGLREPPAAVGARGVDEDSGEPGEADHDRDEGEDSARRQRGQLVGAEMADHHDVDHVHQRPVEAGQHDRPGEPQDTPRLVSQCCPVVVHGRRR